MDIDRWRKRLEGGESILKVARDERVDPGTISTWLREGGTEVGQGHHRVRQPALKISPGIVDLAIMGSKEVLKVLQAEVWGIRATESGNAQLERYCKFVKMHLENKGVQEIAQTLGVHRSTVAKWREGTDRPYLIGAAQEVVSKKHEAGWKWLPLHLDSGGNKRTDWVQVPEAISRFGQLAEAVGQLSPTQDTWARAGMFGLDESQVAGLKLDLLAYVLGIMLGDAGKQGGLQPRFSSMEIDLQLTQKEASNERLGEFVAMCLNIMGLRMDRAEDKQPTGQSRRAEFPSPAFRWVSERSPLIAWMFKVCMGLNWGQTTSTDPVRMDWILDTPFGFRKRFLQGLADSDGTVRNYVVEIASLPNAEFTTTLLRSLQLGSARTIVEGGRPTRSSVKNHEAAKLPLFNELVSGYRYRKLMSLQGIRSEG